MAIGEFEQQLAGPVEFRDAGAHDVSPAPGYRFLALLGGEEASDDGDGESGVAGGVDEFESADGRLVVAALAAFARRFGEESHLLVVADGGGCDAGGVGEFANGHVLTVA